MASLLSTARLLGLFLPLSLMACGTESALPPADSESSPGPSLPSVGRVSAFSLERVNQGPYLEHTVERFQALSSRADVKSVLWSASGGKLETQGMQATWTLPRAGTASLTLTARTSSGQELTETYQFRVSAEASTQTEGSPFSVPLAPVAVDTTNDDTGSTCDLAFDPTGNGHLVYYNSKHPSIWYGAWNGSTWTTQQVDGLGFNTGGIASSAMSLAVDATGRPHIAYVLEGKGVWYATLSGTTWIREQVSTAALAPDYVFGIRVGIALDPSLSSRPTIVYTYKYNDPSRGSFSRPVVAYRTGTNAWTANGISFPASTGVYTEEALRGEILFDPSGTLYIPFGESTTTSLLVGLGTWKVNTTPTSIELNLPRTYGSDVSLARTSAGHILMARGTSLLDFTPAASWPSSTSTTSIIDTNVSAGYYSGAVNDMIFAAGKPQIIQVHGTSLEQISPNASNYWTYTDVGSVKDSERVSIAYRPTTGTVHYCFRFGSKVMFQ